MTNITSDETSKDETIQRLINENSILNKLIKQAKFEFSFIQEVEGLTFEASIKKMSLICKEQKKLIRNLEEELKKLKKDKSIY